jgi:hypothetical protein
LFVVYLHDMDTAWQITDWPQLHGATLPAPGAAVLVGEDEYHNKRVVWWDGVFTSGSFIPLAFQNGYVNFDAGGPTGHQQGGYALDGEGFINLRGLISKPTPWVPGETIALLPPGACPGSSENFMVRAKDATAGNFIASVALTPPGLLILVGAWYPAIATPAALAQLSLASLRFQQAL